MWNKKEMHQLDIGLLYALTLDFTHDLDLRFFQGQISKYIVAVSREFVWLMWNKRGSKSVGYWADYVTLKSSIWSVGPVQVAHNPALQSGAPPTTYYSCLHSNHAQWSQQWQPPQSFLMQFVTSLFGTSSWINCCKYCVKTREVTPGERMPCRDREIVVGIFYLLENFTRPAEL